MNTTEETKDVAVEEVQTETQGGVGINLDDVADERKLIQPQKPFVPNLKFDKAPVLGEVGKEGDVQYPALKCSVVDENGAGFVFSMIIPANPNEVDADKVKMNNDNASRFKTFIKCLTKPEKKNTPVTGGTWKELIQNALNVIGDDWKDVVMGIKIVYPFKGGTIPTLPKVGTVFTSNFHKSTISVWNEQYDKLEPVGKPEKKEETAMGINDL